MRKRVGGMCRLVMSAGYSAVLAVGLYHGYGITQRTGRIEPVNYSSGQTQGKISHTWEGWGERLEWTGEEEVETYVYIGDFLYAKTKGGETIVLTDRSMMYRFKWMRGRLDRFSRKTQFQTLCKPFLWVFETCSPPMSRRIRTRYNKDGIKYGDIIQ
jgi:hypothetical protein